MKKNWNNPGNIDEQLANFTDKILEGRTGENEKSSAQDPELRALQQTVLRLKNTFPDDGPSEEAIQRIRQNVIQQWQEQESKSRTSFWMKFLPRRQTNGKKWQSLRSRQRWSLASYIVTALFLLLLISPFINKVSSGQPAASGQSFTYSLFILFGGVILLALWYYSRKR